ncbi:MAG: hypothetical protein KKG43_04165 [Candidatus Omnitrophica bacterium]|nr:hypothetical protein [Candidatus Omnitrophota bacterium]MBU1928701.1 hypothetical protein [Candidatus Omnitrophota bacterium]MBU2035365.1 hypothetical protein [Candidatus Omnitrophota bacterium]MBU2221240.1 hypothetical protein [Candidatus Omnitrophota bacterium]
MAELNFSRINFYRKLDLAIHFLVAVIISSVIYLKTGKISYVAAFLAGSIFIDLDHFIDYFLYFKNKFSLSDFLKCTYLNSGKVYVFFHSWEINILIFTLGLFFNSTVLLMLSLGLTFHLIVDNFFRKNKFYCFLIYRKINKFDIETLLPELYPYYRNF